MDEAKKWLNMAEEDLLWAKASLKEEIWRGACFAAPYYLSSRYPDVAEFEEYSQEMANAVVQKAEEIIEFIKSKLN